MEEMDLREEVRVAWGTGIAGYVAESGEPVNIPDAYQVKLTNDNMKSYFFHIVELDLNFRRLQ